MKASSKNLLSCIYKFRIFFFILILFNNVDAICQSNNSHSLEYYIEAGLKNSPVLIDLNNQIASRSIDSNLILSNFKPQVNVLSQAIYAPTFKNGGYDEAITNGGIYSGILSVNQPIFIKSFKSIQFQEIGIAVKSISNSILYNCIELKKKITEQYLNTFAIQSQIKFNQSLISLLIDERSIIKQLVEKGVYLQTDYLNISTGITAQKILIKQLNNSFYNELVNLNSLCGIEDTSIVELVKVELPSFIENNLALRPAYLQFSIDSLSNYQNKLKLGLNYRPRINLYADAGFNAITPENIPNRLGTSIGFNLIVPIYDGNKKKLQIDKINYEEDSRINFRNFYVKQHSSEYYRLSRQLVFTQEIISDIKSQIAEQENIINLYKSEIEKGLVRFMDFMTILSNYALAKNNLTITEANQQQIINMMNYIK